MIINNILLIIMVFANYLRGVQSYAVLGALFLAVMLLNLKCVFQLVQMVVPKRILAKIPFINKLF